MHTVIIMCLSVIGLLCFDFCSLFILTLVISSVTSRASLEWREREYHLFSQMTLSTSSPEEIRPLQSLKSKSELARCTYYYLIIWPANESVSLACLSRHWIGCWTWFVTFLSICVGHAHKIRRVPQQWRIYQLNRSTKQAFQNQRKKRLAMFLHAAASATIETASCNEQRSLATWLTSLSYNSVSIAF